MLAVTREGTPIQPQDKTAERSAQADRAILKRVAGLFAGYRGQLVLVLGLTLFATLLDVVNPLLTAVLIDRAIGGRDLRLLLLIVGAMLAAPVLRVLVTVLQTYLNAQIGQKVMRDLRNDLYRHLQRMPLHFFASTRTGEIQSRLANDVGGIEGFLTTTFTAIVRNLAVALSTVVAMLILSPLLTLISLGFTPIVYLISSRVGRLNRSINKEKQERLSSLTALMQETLSVSGALLIKLFGRQPLLQGRFERENQSLADIGVRQQLVGISLFMATMLIFSLAPVIVYLIAGWQIIQNPAASITIGTIVAFTALQNRLVGFGSPITQLLDIRVQLQGALALFERVFAYLDLPVEIEDKPQAKALRAAEIQGKITFRRVSFAYPRDAELTPVAPAAVRWALKDISFEAAPGQLVALVGPSGAGKTTLTSLVPRLYDVTEGAIEIDGHDVRDVTLASLSEIIGVVTQETYLFHASVRENLLFARDGASEAQMLEAAKAAAIHERIMRLEEGYDTLVGERGYKLSGGEKQRVAIARAILKDPRILILDEATSALDTRSERLTQEALTTLMAGRTTLAIAHRLSTILSADLILVVDGGRIVESGNHAQLLALGGLYARLYREQIREDTLRR